MNCHQRDHVCSSLQNNNSNSILGEEWTYSDWAPGTPDTNGDSVDTVWNFASGQYWRWQWNDVFASMTKYFICETTQPTSS